jgi:hypothetical protein
MKAIYKPKRKEDTSVIPGQQEAVAWLVPDTPRDKYFFFMVIHGVGEWSNGTIDNLRNLVDGFDNDNDGIREGKFITDDIKRAVDDYGMIVAVVTYERDTFFEPSRINWVYDQVKSAYNIHDKMILSGFSYGGGAVYKYISSSVANAARVAYALPVAGTKTLLDKTIPGKAGTVVHGFSNLIDPRVASSNTTSQIASINESNPAVKAIYTLWNRNDHSGDKDVWSYTPPKAPGGQGFTDAAENIFQVFTDIVLTGKPRQMKSGVVIDPIPNPIPDPTPVILKAEFNITDKQIVTTPVLDLDASASTGVKAGEWNAYVWDVKVLEGPAPSAYNVRPEVVFDSDPKNKLTNIVNGRYSITLTVRDAAGNKATKTVEITAAVTGKIAIGFDSSTDLITYSDGSTEKATAVFSNGKWTVKNSAGQLIAL